MKTLQALEAVEGSSATLECQVIGSPELSVLWYKDGSRLRQTTRVRTEFDGKTCLLIFLRVELDDEADYKCVVRNDFGMASNESELLVQEELTAPFFRKKLNSQKTKAGQDSHFDVLVGGSPSPQVHWFKGGEAVEDKGMTVIREDVDHGKFSLTIRNTDLGDSGTVKCVAFNEVGEASCEASLTVLPLVEQDVPHSTAIESPASEATFDLQGGTSVKVGTSKPCVPKKNLADSKSSNTFELQVPTSTSQELEAPHFIDLPEGSTPFEVTTEGDVKLKVRAKGKPVPEVRWLKDEMPLLESSHLVLCSDGDQHTLIIQSPTPKDKGTYVCVASNEAGTATRNFDVNIEGSEDWFMPAFENDLENPFRISEDGTVTMEVKVTGNPVPEIEWTKDDEPLKVNERIQIHSLRDIHTVMIKDASPDDAGNYNCTATNPAGKSIRTFTVDIDGAKSRPVNTELLKEALAPPEVIEMPEKGPSFEVSDDGDIRLEVQFTGKPKIEWSKDGKPLQQSSNFDIQSKYGVQTLVIKGATPDKKGIYKCMASNDAGVAWRTFTVDFEGKEASRPVDESRELTMPYFVEDQEVAPFEVTDKGDVELKARVGGKPKPQVQWEKDETPLEDNNHTVIFSEEDLHTLLVQSPSVDDGGTYRLIASNEAGVVTRTFNVEIEGSFKIIFHDLHSFTWFLFLCDKCLDSSINLHSVAYCCCISVVFTGITEFNVTVLLQA